MEAAWAAESRLTPDAAEFVRFCYQRRGVGWPELYDEMCAVASRGLFRGWGSDELARNGIGFGLFELPALAALVARVVAEAPAPGRERARRGARPPELVRAVDVAGITDATRITDATGTADVVEAANVGRPAETAAPAAGPEPGPARSSESVLRDGPVVALRPRFAPAAS